MQHAVSMQKCTHKHDVQIIWHMAILTAQNSIICYTSTTALKMFAVLSWHSCTSKKSIKNEITLLKGINTLLHCWIDSIISGMF